MKKYLTLIASLSFSCVMSYAQLYADASSNLPNNGAKSASMDVRAVDIDYDGDLDIILANEFQPNTILMNDGHGVFTKMASGTLPQEVHDSEDIAIADFNMDGFVDLIFCSEDDIHQGLTNVHEYYINDGAGKFTDGPFQFPDSESNAVITAFINNDLYPDVIFGNKGFNRIYLNNGDGIFELDADALPEINRTTQDLAMADVDLDGDLDLFAGNENGNVLYINDGTGTFADSSSTHLPQGINMETRKATFGDIDGDQDMDLFLSNVMFIQGKNIQNRLYINDGHGKFTDVTSTQLPADSDQTIDAIFEDVDFDQDLDIVVANVFGARIKIYRNEGTGTFTDATNEVLGTTYTRDALSVIASDLNGDGLRDLYICDRFMPQQNKKDLLLVRNPVTAVPGIPKSATELLVYPNQISDEFFVETNKTGLEHVRLLNLEGKLVDTIRVEIVDEKTYKGSIIGLSLAVGIYVIQLPGSDVNAAVMVKY